MDPRLSPVERTALNYLILSEKKGGVGWSRKASAGLKILAMLEAGETRTDEDEAFVNLALKMAARGGAVPR